MSWMGVSLRLCAVAVLLSSGCGGDSSTPEPGELVADPAIATGCLTDGVAAGATRAKVIECAGEVPSGLLASGRVGDFVLENHTVKVVVRAFGEGFVFPGTSAGGIVDAVRIGEDDLVKEVIPLLELNVSENTEFVITEAGDDGPATVVVRGPATPVGLLEAAVNTPRAPAIVETHYILPPDTDALEIRTYLFADGDSSGALQVGEIFFFSGAIETWLPGVGSPEGITNAEFVASRGPSGSFGVVYPAEQTSVQFLSIQNVTGVLGPLVEPGVDSDPISRFLIIGDGSVSSITDRAWEIRGTPVGTVSGQAAPGIEVTANDVGMRPITQAVADESGRYELTLPAGSYELSTGSPGHLDGAPSLAAVTEGGSDTYDLAVGGSGTLVVNVADPQATPLPARVVITDLTDRRVHYTGVDGSVTIPLPEGGYTVDVSRGVEYDAFTVTPLMIGDGATETVNATLTRVVDTDGWIAIDTHIHSEMSLDSQVPLPDRLHSIAAEGIEIALSTDHDFVTDYGPTIEATGLSPWLAYRSGVETSTFAFGHINAWPLTPDYDLSAGGAFQWYGVSPPDLFAEMRTRNPNILIQINHPRSSSGYFGLIDFNRATGMANRDPADIGFPGADLDDFNFDAVEVGNAFSGDESLESFDDWLALVASGHPAAATGSSDSHGKTTFIGKSRTYLYVGPGNDTPGTVDLNAAEDALRARAAVVSQGAFVTAAIEDPATGLPAVPGATVDLSGQTMATLHIKVQAPPWMPLAEIRVYHGVDVATTLLLDPGDTAVVRYDQAIQIPIAAGQDGFFVVFVEPGGRGDPVLSQPDGSFTNPLMYGG